MKRLVWLSIILLFASVHPAQSEGKAVVLVTFEGLSLNDMLRWDIPEFRQLIRIGAIGLMNNKTAACQNFEDNAVTIGAGTRGMGFERPTIDAFSKYAANADEKLGGETAATIWQRNTGFSLKEPAAVLQTKIAAVIAANSGLNYDVIPGILGELLYSAGVKTAVYGNSDRGSSPFRPSVMIAMNKRGVVSTGDVSKKVTSRDGHWPFGMRTNYAYILSRVRELNGNKFVVVEAGDGGRVEAAGADLMPSRFEYYKRLAAAECAHFLVDLNKYLKASTERYLLIFIVPAPNMDAYANGNRLTPIIMVGTDVAPGVVTSSVTKREGLITNLDIAPTVLKFFGIKPHPSMLGQPIVSMPIADSIGQVKQLNEETTQVFNGRRPVLLTYIAIVIIVTAMGILGVIWQNPGLPILRSILHPLRLRFLMLACLISPAILLLAPAFHLFKFSVVLVYFVVSSLILALVLSLIRDSRTVFGVTGVGVAAVFMFDMLAKSPLSKHSIFGYDPIIGLRFYGIGNESVGVLMGALILGIFSFLDRRKFVDWKYIVPIALLFMAVVLVVGAPNFGTNFGGTLAMLAGFGFSIFRAYSSRSRLRMVILVVAVAIILFVGVIIANVMVDSEHKTHIGRAITQSKVLGPHILAELALRKWAMNLRLIKYSFWTYMFFCLIVGMVILFIRPVGILKRTLLKHPIMNAAFAGMLAGAVVGMATNDSGIVMATTTFLYMAFPLIWMVRMELEARQNT
ncbi:MAG: hypothetical protein QHH26_00615 [Armatimonadota bacterium]|nr:hypothetical protein [Armatimonadota bacterium]